MLDERKGKHEPASDADYGNECELACRSSQSKSR